MADRLEQVLELRAGPDSRRAWAADLSAHLEVMWILTRKDFQTRYKRASFGVVWAVAVPVLQAVVMAVVFSRVVKDDGSLNFPLYVMSGIVAFSYFSLVLSTASTAIVDSAAITDKIWFPRVILVIVPCLSNLVGFGVTLLALVIVMPLLGGVYSIDMLLLVPGSVLLILFTTALSMIMAALHVYYRDVKFLVQAALLVWLYVTPILYPTSDLGHLAVVAAINPVSGPVDLYHLALGMHVAWKVPVVISVSVTLVLLVVAAEVQRRHDRLFVDLL